MEKPASAPATRRPKLVGADSSHVPNTAGATSNTCSCLAKNPKPRKMPAAAIHRTLPSSRAFVVDQNAETISNTSMASGLLNLNISAATGVNASVNPATSPATSAHRA